jgi:Domain of unknown function (DUF4384)
MHKTLAAVLAAFALISAAKAAEGPTARDRYFEAARNRDSEWTGIRTSVLLRRGTKDNATLREVGESADFHSGDQFRLRFQSNDDGYAYLLFQTQHGDYQLVYPAKGAKTRSNQVNAFEDRVIPGRSKEWMTFDNKPAIEGLYLVFSAKPVAELERAAGGPGMLSKSEFDSLMGSNGRTSSMVFDEPEDYDSGIVPATFYVERRAANREFLVRKIDLVHRNSPRQKDADR